jgi:hypothetical protein
MSKQVQDTQDARQGTGGSSTPAPPQGFYTAFEMELS